MHGNKCKILILLGEAEKRVICEQVRCPWLCRFQFPILDPFPSAGHGDQAIGGSLNLQDLISVLMKNIVCMSTSFHVGEIVLKNWTLDRVISGQFR